jgi:glycerol-3-phosphate cytidylyltransferase
MKPYGIAFVPGGFDMFHIGHLTILRHAESIADRVIAGVVDDETLLVMKNRRPVVGLRDRAEIVGSIGIVDEVAVLGSTSKVDAWNRLGFDVLVKGDDWQNTPKGDALEREMRAIGVDVAYFPYTPGTSSTVLRDRLRVRTAS